ncbi:hypothetical protein JKP88DRAFT_166963 [Tribonema minus]|uniref:EF-hand domain-containing protein n=1 Tax=Tribonema minus TaxID=303371 RepID=A0A836CDL9_9STRA|nr:hypothetical protein JKP88DRAFT_166963 [Tribonema minus]
MKHRDDASVSSTASSGEIGDETANALAVQELKKTMGKLPPEAIFAIFDKDNDGTIDFEEFKAILPQLGIEVSLPKALRYFRTCDKNGNGSIDLDEFKMALFAVDPDNGNPVGFAPNSLLSPMDAFDMFDTDKSGNIDEDEFFFLLQFLGVEVSEERLESLFKQYDTNGNGTIEYDEFKKIWVRLANVKKELADRGIKIPKLATHGQLVRKLERILDEEEEREARALAEAERWGRWQALLRGKRAAHRRAKLRAEAELKTALDAAGSVYVFGTGAYREFAADPPREAFQGRYRYQHWDLLKELWGRRVAPTPEVGTTLPAAAAAAAAAAAGGSAADGSSAAASSASSSGSGGVQRSACALDSQKFYYDPERDATTSPFRELSAGRSTAGLWGKRIASVALSEGAAFALSELGEVFAWGGRSHWWHDLAADSHWQTHWRGDTTARSQLLLQTTGKGEFEGGGGEGGEGGVRGGGRGGRGCTGGPRRMSWWPSTRCCASTSTCGARRPPTRCVTSVKCN